MTPETAYISCGLVTGEAVIGPFLLKAIHLSLWCHYYEFTK